MAIDLITGTPGAGKTLLAVWEICRSVPGSTLEVEGENVPRRLFTNIKGLLVEHQHIGPEDLNTWHEWAKPGDVIVFDEVQEVWRPRSLGSNVPDAVKALETHRHRGVDIALVTQHPMLLDTNVRRLVNRHRHIRRIRGTPLAVVYEWDHCSNPGLVKNSISMKPFRHPRSAYSLYKSAQAHTKQRVKPSLVIVAGIVALGVFGWTAPGLLGKLTGGRIGTVEAKTPDPVKPQEPLKLAAAPTPPASAPAAPHVPAQPSSAPVTAQPVKLAGCGFMAKRCTCFDTTGEVYEKPKDFCEARTGADRPTVLAAVPQSLREEPRPAPPTPPEDLDALAFMALHRNR